MDDWLFTLQYNADNADKGIAWSAHLTNVEWRAEGSNQIVFTLPDPNFRFHQGFIGHIAGTFGPIAKHVWEGQVTCPPKAGPVTMLELGRGKGEIWLRGDIRRSR